jgi:hypothetical protein
MFTLEYKEVAGLKRLPAYQRRRILDTIEEQLKDEPQRKIDPAWVGPLRQLKRSVRHQDAGHPPER